MKRAARIDKSKLAFGVPSRLRDKAYRESARSRPCDNCGSIGTTVLAHIAITGNSGMGTKPPDDESVFLCFDCHGDLDQSTDRSWWLVRNILLPIRRRVYREWKDAV